jgi:hypothetical protein
VTACIGDLAAPNQSCEVVDRVARLGRRLREFKLPIASAPQQSPDLHQHLVDQRVGVDGRLQPPERITSILPPGEKLAFICVVHL